MLEGTVLKYDVALRYWVKERWSQFLFFLSLLSLFGSSPLATKMAISRLLGGSRRRLYGCLSSMMENGELSAGGYPRRRKQWFLSRGGSLRRGRVGDCFSRESKGKACLWFFQLCMLWLIQLCMSLIVPVLVREP